MFCPNCGYSIDPAAKFCPNCGAAIPSTDQTDQPGTETFEKPQMPMKWFKFLIYFALFAGAVINIVNGISNLFSQSLFIEEVILNKTFAIATIALGAFGIYTRFRLAGFYKNGPQMLLYLYAASVTMSFVYGIAFISVFGNASALIAAIPSIIVGCIMIGVNNVYFQNRSHLFNK